MKYIELPAVKEKYDYRQLIDMRSIICIVLTVALIVISALFFKNSYYRLWRAMQDFGQSIGYSFCELFRIPHNIELKLNSFDFGLPGTDGTAPVLPSVFIPSSFDSYKAKLELYLLVFNLDNFKYYFAGIGSTVSMVISMFMLIGIALILSVKAYMNHVFSISNNNYGIESKPLYIAKRSNDIIFRPVKTFVLNHYDFIRETKVYWVTWLIIGALSFNVVSIVLSFFAYYFYFATGLFTGSMAFSTLYIQLYKFFVDISPLFTKVGWWAIVIIALIAWLKFREMKAMKNLYLFDKVNETFVDKLKLAVFIVGSMGAGKTTLLVSIMLDVQRRHRRAALDILHDRRTQFPSFPWSEFERVLKKAIKNHTIYNLRSARRFVELKEERFIKNSTPNKLYGYDYNKYGLYYNNGSKIISLFDIMDDYARAFFLYFFTSTLLVSNISVRDDAIILDKGNFPLYNDDYLSRSSRDIELYSSYAHIFDFDMFRLGQKIIEDNQYTNVLEFFSLGITEIAKERGNQNDLKEVKKNDDEANPKNDFFDKSLNLMRHPAMIGDVCFAFILFDDQRTGALSANMVNLSTVIEISAVTKRKNAMPGFWFFRTLHDIIYKPAMNKLDQYEFNRADNTLFKHSLFLAVAKLHRHNEEMYNRYGYKQATLTMIDGMTAQRTDETYPYFYIFKKVYRNTFATDCYSSMLDSGTNLGLADVPCYKSLNPTADEFSSQNSYWINNIKKFNKTDKNN